MASAVAFNPDISDIETIAIKLNGNIKQMAEHFNVSRETIYQFIKRDPRGKEIIDRVRGYNTETDLDLAEQVIRYNMANLKNNPGLAQRAAEKVIDKKGHLRGWENKNDQNPSDIKFTVNYDNTRNNLEISPENVSTKNSKSSK